MFQPDASFVPWRVSKIDSTEELADWNKRIRPNKADYKDFKDDAHWVKGQEAFTATLESQNLLHTIDPKYTSANDPLYLSQKKWVYDVIATKFLAPAAKSIIA
jgi:hypothetical protein